MAERYGTLENIKSTEIRSQNEIDELPEFDDDGEEIDELPNFDDDSDEIDELPEVDDNDSQEEPGESIAKEEGEVERRIEAANDVVENRMPDAADNKFMELTEDQRDKLRGLGMSEALISKCKVDKNGVFYLKTTNGYLEGKEHPETGVKFSRKIITVNDVQIEGVFPDFPAEFTCYLPENLIIASDKKQFTECVKQLAEKIEEDPEFAKMFTPRQRDQIMKGDPRISGYTWHHNEEAGKMELVKAEIHQKTKHDGGKSIWSGGTSERQ